MNEPLIVTTLRTKAQALESYIATGEEQLKRARADLAHVLAVAALYELEDPREYVPATFNTRYLFKHGEVTALVREALVSGPKTSRELAEYVIGKKDGLDTTDRQLVSTMTHRVATGMSKLVARKAVEQTGTVRNGKVRAAVWRLTP